MEKTLQQSDSVCDNRSERWLVTLWDRHSESQRKRPPCQLKDMDKADCSLHQKDASYRVNPLRQEEHLIFYSNSSVSCLSLYLLGSDLTILVNWLVWKELDKQEVRIERRGDRGSKERRVHAPGHQIPRIELSINKSFTGWRGSKYLWENLTKWERLNNILIPCPKHKFYSIWWKRLIFGISYNMAHVVIKQRERNSQSWSSVSLLILHPAHGTVLHTVRVGLSSPIKSLWTHPYRCAKKSDSSWLEIQSNRQLRLIITVMSWNICNRALRSCSISLLIKEMQIKTIMEY